MHARLLRLYRFSGAAVLLMAAVVLLGLWLDNYFILFADALLLLLLGTVGVYLWIHPLTEQLAVRAETLNHQVIEAEAARDQASVERADLQHALEDAGHRLRIAREIQFQLFPMQPPSVPGIDIAGATFPAEEVDGDYFDYLRLPDESLLIAIGDACGHGLGAALIAARTQACLHTLCRVENDVDQMMAQLNNVLCDGMPDDRFMTLLLARLDAEQRTLTYASAGHATGYVLRRDGSVRLELTSTAMPLGVEAQWSSADAYVVALEPHDLIVLLTDGIIEAQDPRGESFGVNRLVRLLHASWAERTMDMIMKLNDAVTSHCAPRDVIDDISAVVIRVDGQD